MLRKIGKNKNINTVEGIILLQDIFHILNTEGALFTITYHPHRKRFQYFVNRPSYPAESIEELNKCECIKKETFSNLQALLSKIVNFKPSKPNLTNMKPIQEYCQLSNNTVSDLKEAVRFIDKIYPHTDYNLITKTKIDLYDEKVLNYQLFDTINLTEN